MKRSGQIRRLGLIAAAAWMVVGVCGAWCLGRPTSKQRVTVLAASSLTDAFTALAKGFEQRFPDTQVELVFAGSQILRMQVQAGAPGDLIASAHPEHLVALHREGLALPAKSLAGNRLALVVGPSIDPMPWREVIDLPRWILGSPQVPVGRYAQELLARMGEHVGPERIQALRARVLSTEPNVRMVRTKVEMGQADAAIVYASDLREGVAIQEVALPQELAVEVEYQIALLGPSASDRAQRFFAFARSRAGQEILVAQGFLPRKEAL